MRPERLWMGMSLATAAVAAAMTADLPVVVVTVDHNTATGQARAAGGAPFEALREATWCADDGACWSSVDGGLEATTINHTVYGSIGLREGDVLTHFGAPGKQRSLTDIADLQTFSWKLEKNREACLIIERADETIQLGIVLPPSRKSSVEAATGAPCEPPPKKPESTRSRTIGCGTSR